jgi:tetratricopeptide (TPR) repeat protein
MDIRVFKHIAFIVSCVLFVACGKTALKEQKSVPSVDYNTAQKVKYFYAESVTQLQKGNYDAAFDLLKHCIELNPYAAEAYYGLTPLYAEMGMDTLALENMEKAVSLRPDNVTYQERLAQTYLGTKQWDKAINTYERIMSYSPTRTDVLGILIQLYGQNKDYDNIIRCLDRVENIEGASEQTALSKMHIYSLKGEKDKELQVLEDLVKKHPNDMNYRVMKGNWLIQNGMHEEAFEEYQFALRQDPKHVAARLSLLDYYRTLDKDSLANALQEDILESPEIPTNDKVMLVRKVVAENEQNGADSTQVLDLFHRVLSKPQHSADMTAMYAAYLQMKNFPQDSINTVYYQALKIEPDNASVRLALIQSLWKEQNFDEIIRLSKEATQYNPDEMAFYYFLGVCYFQKGNNDASLDALRRGVSQINSKSNKEFVSDFYAIMGDILHEKGKSTEAYAAYDSCLQWKPDNISCLNNYAYFLSEEDKDLDKAERMSKKTIDEEPENPTYLDTYAWILFKQQRYEEAQKYIDKVLELSPSPDATLLEHAGDIYSKTGNTKEAVAFWKKALEGKSKNAKLIRKKIKQRKYLIK